MDGPGIRRKQQYGFKSNAHQGGAGAVTASTSSSGKRKGKAAASAGGGGDGKKQPPIKLVFIGNPVRVTTSEADFRALVQELTGRHADPYKYSVSGGRSGAAIDVDADDSSRGSPVDDEPRQSGALLLPSPVSTPSSDAASASGAAQAASVPAYDDDEDDGFAPQLIDNSYSVFSPPTFLYGPHGVL